MTNLAFASGAAPYGGGSGFPTSAELRDFAAQAGRNAVGHLVRSMARGSAMSATEVAAMRALTGRVARSAARLHPWIRAVDLALQGYEAAQAAGIPLPEFSDMLEGLFGAYRGWFADGRWSLMGTCTAGGSGFFYGASTLACGNFTTLYSNTRWNNYVTVSGRLNFWVTSKVDIGGGWRGNPSAWWQSEVGVTAAWPPRLTAAGVPARQRVVYPAAVNVGVQIPAVPHHIVGQVNRWRQLIRPREDGKPIRDNGAVAAPPRVVAFPSVGIGSGIKVDTATPPHKFAPPKKGEKEKKAVAKGKGVNMIFAALNKVRKYGNDATEAVDFVTAIYYALPEEAQDAGRRPSVTAMLQSIADNWADLDAGRAVINLGIASASDYAIGKSSEGLRQQILKYRGDTPLNRERPWFYGPLL